MYSIHFNSVLKICTNYSYQCHVICSRWFGIVCVLYIVLLIYLYLLPTVFLDAPPCKKHCKLYISFTFVYHTHTLFAGTQLYPHSHNSFTLLFGVHICSSHVLCTVKFKITLIIRKWKFFFLFPISNLSLIKWQHLYTVYIYIL